MVDGLFYYLLVRSGDGVLFADDVHSFGYVDAIFQCQVQGDHLRRSVLSCGAINIRSVALFYQLINLTYCFHAFLNKVPGVLVLDFYGFEYYAILFAQQIEVEGRDSIILVILYSLDAVDGLNS